MSHYQQRNLDLLAQRHPASWQTLQALDTSPYIWQDGHLLWQGQTWPLAENWDVPAHAGHQYLIYGLGNGKELQRLLNALDAKARVYIFDPLPEITQALLPHCDFTPIWSDPRVTYLALPPLKLSLWIHQFVEKQKDLMATWWIENGPIAALAAQTNELVLTLFGKLSQHLAAGREVSPAQHLQELETTYRQVSQQSQAAYQAHPELSCRAGCSACCRQGNGLHMFIRPAEWHRILGYLHGEMPKNKRRQLFLSTARYLKEARKYLVNVQYFLDRRMDLLQTHTNFTRLTEIVEDKLLDPCPFLGPDEACTIYPARPLICRLYGCSFFAPAKPYTCSMDQDKHSAILEQAEPRLIEASQYFRRNHEIHAYQPFGHVLYAWLFTHMDFARGDFIAEPRLDYNQFQLLQDPAEREPRFAEMDAWLAEQDRSD